MARISVYKVQDENHAAISLGFANGELVSFGLNTVKADAAGISTFARFTLFVSHIVTCVKRGEIPHNAKSPEPIRLFVEDRPRAFYRFLKRARKYGLLFPIRYNDKLYYAVPAVICEE